MEHFTISQEESQVFWSPPTQKKRSINVPISLRFGWVAFEMVALMNSVATHNFINLN